MVSLGLLPFLQFINFVYYFVSLLEKAIKNDIVVILRNVATKPIMFL